MNLLMAVERHLRANSISATRFGRQVSGDPRFVFDLRRGREPRPATTAKVLAHIAGCPPDRKLVTIDTNTAEKRPDGEGDRA